MARRSSQRRIFRCCVVLLGNLVLATRRGLPPRLKLSLLPRCGFLLVLIKTQTFVRTSATAIRNRPRVRDGRIILSRPRIGRPRPGCSSGRRAGQGRRQSSLELALRPIAWSDEIASGRQTREYANL